jgi:hypothetical protein
MSKPGPETRLVLKARKAARVKYVERLVDIKYHGDAFSEVGVSDVLCCLDGIFVAAEFKAPESYKVKGQPSVEKAVAAGATVKQRLFIDSVVAAGGIGGVVASVEGFLDLLLLAELLAKDKGLIT